MDVDVAARVQDLESLLPQIQTLQSDPQLPPAKQERELARLNDAAALILAKAPESPQVLTAAARVSTQLGDYQTAINRATLALNHEPQDPAARAARALAYYATCDFPKAHADAQTALKNDPQDPVATSIYKLSNRPKGCGTLTAEALEQKRERLDDLLKMVSQKGYTKEGAVAFAKLLDRAAEELKHKQWSPAYQDATRALIEYPDNPRALAQRIEAEMHLKGYREAAADATRGLKLKPDSWQFLSNRAMANNEAGRYKDALKDASTLIRVKPDLAEAWLVRGLSRRKLGDPPLEYLEDFRQAAKLDVRYRPLYEGAITQAEGITPKDILAELRARMASAEALLVTYSLAVLVLALAAISVALALYRNAKERTLVIAGQTPEGRSAVAIGSYQIGGVIGHGGMGTVYEGFDKHLDRKVAIKELQPALRNDKRERDRFLQEARLVAQLAHPNIVAIYAVVKEELRVLLIFEFIEGKTLAQLLDSSPGRRLHPEEALPIVAQVCSALEYAHGKHVIHRDLKPSNIMVHAGIAKVMDFGIARQAKDALMSRTGTVVGTPYYMAPEMEEGQVGVESDLYSLGVTLYEALTGSLPFRDVGLQRQKEDAEFPKPTSVDTSLPTALDAFFRSALAADPEERFATASDFREAFGKAIGAA